MSSPSYFALFNELKATRPHTDQVWRINPKLTARLWAIDLGLRVPRVLAYTTHTDDLHGLEPSLAVRAGAVRGVVLKPNHGCSARCVFPLVPEGNLGTWRSLFDPMPATWSGWVRQLQQEEARIARQRRSKHPDDVAGPWLIEELLVQERDGGPCLPDDWKAVVIRGRVQLWAQFRRYGRRPRDTVVCYRDRDFREAPEIKPDRAHTSLPGPEHPDELIAAAETAGRAFPAPFVRVDLYDCGGVWFSEVTPEPGGSNRFSADWDRRLGEAWLAPA